MACIEHWYVHCLLGPLCYGTQSCARAIASVTTVISNAEVLSVLHVNFLATTRQVSVAGKYLTFDLSRPTSRAAGGRLRRWYAAVPALHGRVLYLAHRDQLGTDPASGDSGIGPSGCQIC